MGEFKTPSLRNVAITGPYMHMGQFASLEDVLAFYNTLENALPLHHFSRDQLLAPANLSDEQTSDLLAFLHSLTDTDLPQEMKSAPATPYLEASDG